MGFVGDIFNLEVGLAVRNKLNVLMKFYNAVVKSDSLFNVERIDASYVKDAVPTTLKYLRDDGTWQTVNISQTLAQAIAIGNVINEGQIITSVDGLTTFILNNGSFDLLVTNGTNLYNSVGANLAKAGIGSEDGTNSSAVSSYPNRNEFYSTLQNDFIAPNNNFPQETINKIARFDAFGNLKSSGIDVNDIDLELAVVNGGIVTGSDNVTPIFEIDKANDLINVKTPTYFYNRPVILGEAVAKVLTLDVGNRVVSSIINTADVQLKSLKGVANGYASLEASGLIPNSQLPNQVIQIISSLAPAINTTGFRKTFVDITALAGNINLSTNLTGAPQNGDVLWFQIKDNGTARTITAGSLFESKGETIPNNTIISKRLNFACTYDTTTSKWGCIAVIQDI